MSGENLARQMGLLGEYPVAVDFRGPDWPIEFLDEDGNVTGAPIGADEYYQITDGLQKSLDPEVWSRLYDNDEEYDLIMSWKILGTNPLTLFVTDPFTEEEGFYDTL